jgi:hypothetical protein
MPAPFFTSNPGEFSRLEGLYIFEKTPPGFIRGAFLGVVGVCGRTEKGPVNTPVEITSEAEFTAIFGHRSYYGQSTEVNEVRNFLMNKPFGKTVVVRAASELATTSSFTAETAAGGGGTAVLRVDASSPGAWGQDLAFKVLDSSDGVATSFDLIVRYRGQQTRYKNLTINGTSDNLASTLGTDYSNLVVLTKLAAGRPVNHTASADGADTDGFVPLGVAVSGYTMVAGTDNTITDSDYTAADGPLALISSYKGIGVCAIATAANSTLNGNLKFRALSSSDRLFLIWNGSHTASISTVTADAANYRSDRVVYCYNSCKTVDQETATTVTTAPHSWVASIMSQVDVDINIGEESTKQYTGAITGLQSEGLSRENYISLKEAGVAAWEKDSDGGFLIVSAVVNDLTSGKEQITRRRSADFLQISAASRLKYFVKKKSTVINRAQIGAELAAFSESLRLQERIVDQFMVDQLSVNTEASRAQGIEKVLWRVKLIGHMLELVLETEIGTTVTFQEQ